MRYAPYDTSSNPPGSNSGLGGATDQITATNKDLAPERSRNIEVGAKWTYASVAATSRKWIPGHARFDASATWRVSKKVDLQLNVNDIFDRKYYQTAYPIYATWAPGRSAMVTLNFYQ